MKRIIIGFILLIGLLALYFALRPDVTGYTENTESTESTESSTQNTETSEDAKTSFALTVVHKDGSKKELTLQTEQGFLGAALLEAGIVEAEENRFGMHIKTADGEKAVFEEDKAYWAVYVGENLADRATDLLPVEEGKTYKLVCTAPAPLTSADDAAEHLFYNVYRPLARGYIGTSWAAAKAFAEHMGYEAIIDEGVYAIRVADNRYIRFGGYLTSVGGATLTSATYHVYTDGVDYVRAGVRGRYRNEKDPINNRENPVYFIDQDFYTDLSVPVESMAEAEQYILDNNTLTLKFFTLNTQDTYGKFKNSYLVATGEELIGKALENAGFITIAEGSDGPYIEKLQGVTPDTGAAWLLWKGNSYTSLPIDTTPVEEGATYTIAYKRIR